MSPEISTAMDAVVGRLRAHGQEFIGDLVAFLSSIYSASVLRTAIWILVCAGTISVDSNYLASIPVVAAA